MSITNVNTGNMIWEHWGVFRKYMSVILELNSTGYPVNAEESNEWDNPISLFPFSETVDDNGI